MKGERSSKLSHLREPCRLRKPTAKRPGKQPSPQKGTNTLGVPSPFFAGILLFRKPSKSLGKLPVFEKNDGLKEWTRNQTLETYISNSPPKKPVWDSGDLSLVKLLGDTLHQLWLAAKDQPEMKGGSTGRSLSSS